MVSRSIYQSWRKKKREGGLARSRLCDNARAAAGSTTVLVNGLDLDILDVGVNNGSGEEGEDGIHLWSEVKWSCEVSEGAICEGGSKLLRATETCTQGPL